MKASREIVLVEDSLLDAEMTIRSLRKNGIDNPIVHLDESIIAKQYLINKAKEGNLPSLLLLDSKMPIVDGPEMVIFINHQQALKHLDVIILASSYPSPELSRCASLGKPHYLTLPLDFNMFMEKVTRLGAADQLQLRAQT